MQAEIPSLYSHQEKSLDDLRAAMVGDRRVILEAPPGFGKTRLAKVIHGLHANRIMGEGWSGNSLFTVHRRGLVVNASDSFSEAPKLHHGVIMAGHETCHHSGVQVASVDSLLSWYAENGEYQTDFTYDLVTIDEAHSHVQKFRTFLAAHDAKRASLGLFPAFVLGLSATPQNRDLHHLFKRIVSGPSTQWLIDNGYLSTFRYFQCTKGDLGKLVKQGDEYTKDSAAAAMQGMAGDLVKDWKRLGQGRSTVGFFPRLSQAREAQEMLLEAGVKAEYVDGSTPDDERKQLFTALNEGRINYLCNVGVIERGTDIPRIGCVQVCTPVGSVVRWRQMIGRGSRVHPDVEDCIILDHATNVRRLGFFEDDIDWTLEWGERPSKEHEARATVECPSCGAVYRGGKCKACGYEPTGQERKSQGLEFLGGELTEIKKREKKAPKKKTCEEMMVSALYAAGKSGRTWGQAWGIAKRQAEKQGTKLRVPAKIEVAGKTYKTIPYGDPDAKLRVRETYGFTVGNHSPAANPYLEQS